MLDRILSWLGVTSRETGRADKVEIKGEKVILREKRLEDAESDYKWRSDPELATFDGVPPLRMSLNSYLSVFREELRYPSRRHRTFAIEDYDGRHIGNCMYYDIDEGAGQAELGILIGEREYWSKGYGTDAVNALLHHIFGSTKLERVYLHTLEWNIRAQKSFEKSGFVRIGEVKRSDNIFIAMEIYRSWMETNAKTGAGHFGDTGETSPE
ncbi:MAG: N-acetyltransferase [Dehalococcoidia bacterium]|nr:N-acetyltransferase [Dehalococcoidia bacterium]